MPEIPHSPGPWQAYRIGPRHWVISSGDVTVAEIIAPYTPGYDREAQDAALIAAAPDLLRQLRLSLHWLACRHHAGSMSVGCIHCAAYQDARAAVEQAAPGAQDRA